MIAYLLSWLLHAVLVMASVAIVSRGNKNNTLPRALLVTFIAALVVTPFAFFWFLLIPGLIAIVVWTLIYTLAYDIGVLQAFGVGILQAVLGALVAHLFVRGRLG